MTESTFRAEIKELIRELKQTQQAQLEIQIKQTEILTELKNVIPRVQTVETKMENLQAFNNKIIGVMGFTSFVITIAISILSFII